MRNDYQEEIRVSKPIFKQVSDICPEMTGVNIRLKVVGAVLDRSPEVLMGDDTGSVVVIVHNPSFRARLHEGSSVIVRNAYVEMKSDAFIRITTNEWGKIEVAEEDLPFTVKRGNNISEVEYTIE